MAVQKSRVTKRRRGNRNSHNHFVAPALSVDAESGQTHRRHCIDEDNGRYRGKQHLIPKGKQDLD